MAMTYVFALLLPFCVIFNTSFNALSDIFCATSNYIINNIFSTSDDTCSISMYSFIVLMVKMWIVVCNIMLIWALLDTPINRGSALSPYSLKEIFEIFGIIILILFTFGICFGFGNAFFCLSG